jgi:hypothetical protein
MKALTSKGCEVGSVFDVLDIEKEKDSDVSPLTSNSATSLIGSGGLRKPKSLRMTVAATAGKKFTVMGGNHLTSDDIFIAAEMSNREKEKHRLLVLKKKCTQAPEIENKGKLVIENKGTDCNNWLGLELDAVLAWYGVQKMSLMGKQQKMDKWREITSKNGQPAAIERWTDELEEQLIAASKTDIAIGDTAVGRYEQKRMKDFEDVVPKFSHEQWATFLSERDQHATNQGLGGDP